MSNYEPGPNDAIFKRLKILGFKRTWRNHGKSGCHIYTKAYGDDRKTLIFVKIWTQGAHNVSHSYDGYEVVRPASFTKAEDLDNAIQVQINSLYITKMHVAKVRAVAVPS